MRDWQPVSEVGWEDVYPDCHIWLGGTGLLGSECILFIPAVAASLRGKRFEMPFLDIA